jgi:hypothetical protein
VRKDKVVRGKVKGSIKLFTPSREGHIVYLCGADMN